jgi:hypothetical protein
MGKQKRIEAAERTFKIVEERTKGQQSASRATDSRVRI